MLIRALAAAALAWLAVAASAQAQRPAPDYPEGFSERVMVGGLQAPTAVAWTPDGRMLVAQKGGELKVAAPGASSANQILDISSRVNHAADRGLLGLAVDANYGGGAGQNRFIYLLYTYDVNPLVADDGDTKTVSRLERFTLSATNQIAFDRVLLGNYVAGACPQARNDLDCIPSDDLSHSIGTVRSDPRDGTLWVGSGDAASFGGTDTLALRTYDEQSMAGKIMHIDREGKGLAQHSFCPSQTDLTLVCTKLFAKGFRNPYRFSLRPNGAGLMVGDVGWNQREEVDLIAQGGKSFGWPCYEGSQRTAGYRDWSQCQAEYAKEGTSQAHTPPQYEYLHEEGRTVIGGPTYTGGNYPSEYDGTIFYGDYGNQMIRRLSVDGQDDVVDHHDFATNWQGMVGLELAPSGNLALVDIGTFSNDGAIRELVYQSREPTARASASPTSGPTPLRVDFDGTLSSDPDGDPLTYRWEFGDGATSTAAKPAHVYTQAGTVTARLTVDDGHGNTDTTTVTLRPGNDAPTATIDAPAAESTYRDGQTITLRGSGTDPQESLGASALSWRVLLHHDTHVHDAHAAAGVATTSFTAARDHDADSYYEVRLTARDSSGLEGTRTIFLRPETVQMNLASTPTGAPVSYGGRDFTAPLSTATTIGFQTSLSAAETFQRGGRTFYFDRWSDGGARQRSSYTVPAADVSLRAFYLEDKAEGMTATASTVQDNEPSFSADAALDRDPGTRWSSDRLDNQYWQVDLRSVRNVDRVRLDWEGAYASQYRIETSTDGTTWSTAAEQTISAPGVRTTQFTTRPARYVRVRGLQRATQYGISFWDARVLGPEDDATAPETTVNSGPSGTLASQSATFTFSGGTGASFECRLDSGPWASCTTPKSYSALAQGQHTFEVRSTAPNGQTDPTPASRTFTVDTVAPETTIGVGPGQGSTITSSSTSFSFTSPELGATFECSLDGAAWAACTSPRGLTGLGDGQHTFSTRAKDAAGNVDAAPDSRTFAVDTGAPETTITAGPSGTINQTSASFTFTGETGGSFDCRLDSGNWESCGSPKDYTSLGQGAHTFQVRAKDAAGNTDQTPATRTFSVDTSPPETTITSGPATGSTITSTAASFAFSGETGGSFDCKLDAGNWESCSSPKAYTGLGQGSHTFSVRAKDALGNTDQTPATRTFSVDTVAPDTSITVGPPPAGTITTDSTSFSFTSPELGATFECSLDGAAWAGCTSPRGLTGLGDGPHTFSVRAKDAAGNVDATPATGTFTVDTAAPDTTIDTGPSGPIAATSASFAFSAEAGSSFDCKLDGGNWESCTSPKSYTGLGQGAHTFQVRAKDTLGNVDQTPASRTFTVDTIAPAVTITGGPTGAVASTSASFAFSSEAGATFECKLDGGAWTPNCNSPKEYTSLGQGPHTFQVRAMDAAGNTGSPATRSFSVDTVTPDTRIDAGPSGTITTTSASFRFSTVAAPNGATFECKLDTGAWEACASPKDLSGLSQGDHRFEVRAKNSAGDVDASPAVQTFRVDTAAPDTAISSGPTGDITTTSAIVGFSSEAGASFECKLDTGAWAPCTSPTTFSGLGVASHTVQVRARDAAGNLDATPATRSFRVIDRTPPNTTITSGPSGTVTGSSQRFTFSSEAGASFQCRVDSGAWFTCVSPRRVTGLKAGAHTFWARARDAAGNVDATPARRDFRIAAGSITPSSTASYGATVRSTPGLTALYGLGDKGTSARATRARPGAYHGSPERVNPLVTGSSDSYARRFDGRNDWIELDPRVLGRRKTFSVELWVELASPRRASVLSLFGRSGAGLGLDLGATARPGVTVRSAKKRAAHVTGPGLRRGRPHHVVASYDGRRLRLYVDGRLSSSARYGTGIGPARGTRLTLGARPGDSRRFKGTLDELALYDRALSASTVKAHFSAGR